MWTIIFYTILITMILLTDLVSNHYYYKSKFYILKYRTLIYGQNTHYWAGGWWLAELLGSVKPRLKYLGTADPDKVGKLPHHFKMMAKAADSGQHYCPARKYSGYDGCMYNPSSGEISCIGQYKVKSPGSSLSMKDLHFFSKKYAHLDEFTLSFRCSADFLKAQSKIDQMNQIQLINEQTLIFKSVDCSFMESATTCTLNLRKLIEAQQINCPTISRISEDCLNSSGEVITNTPIFFS